MPIFGFHHRTLMNITQEFVPTCLGMTNPKLLNGGCKCIRWAHLDSFILFLLSCLGTPASYEPFLVLFQLLSSGTDTTALSWQHNSQSLQCFPQWHWLFLKEKFCHILFDKHHTTLTYHVTKYLFQNSTSRREHLPHSVCVSFGEWSSHPISALYLDTIVWSPYMMKLKWLEKWFCRWSNFSVGLQQETQTKCGKSFPKMTILLRCVEESFEWENPPIGIGRSFKLPT